jgi:hypothetical protein
MSLPFNDSGFDAACSGTNTCAGLGEVKMVGLKDNNERKRRGYEVSIKSVTGFLLLLLI